LTSLAQRFAQFSLDAAADQRNAICPFGMF
jgi:hypothetical protein